MNHLTQNSNNIHILTRAEHPISRSEIPNSALNVLYRLHKNGFQAYLVGGCIRDRLLGKNPKDFDVATNATPEEVQQLFRNSRIIGRRFRIVHVRYGREIIEVTTFRGSSDNATDQRQQATANGMLVKDNVWGNIEEDALRRDFTINALYYSIDDFSIYDYANGLQDLKQRNLRLIGDPETRYREDPVRLLRALRFAAKLNFNLHPQTAAPIPANAQLLLQVSPARLFDEVLKLFLSGQALTTLKLLQEYQLFAFLFPATHEALKTNPLGQKILEQGMRNTDTRIAAERPVTPAFLYALLLWPALERVFQDLSAKGTPNFPAMQQAATRVIQRQNAHTSIPKRFAFPMREIWDLQLKLPQRQGSRAERLLSAPRFRAGYDFLLLREEAGDATNGLAAWWTSFQEANGQEQQTLLSQVVPEPSKRKRSPRKSSTKPKAAL